MSEARAPRLQCAVKKSVHALRGMFYLNRTLSITVANLNSLARKKEKKKKTSRGCPAVLLQQMICCGFSRWCAQTLWTVHQWTARRRSELRAKWIQLKVFDLSVHSTKLPQWFFATSWAHCTLFLSCWLLLMLMYQIIMLISGFKKLFYYYFFLRVSLLCQAVNIFWF